MIPITLDELKLVKKTYEMGFLFDYPVIISYARIKRDSLPEGFYAYDVRHSDDDWGSPVELCPFVRVNYWGTIITNKPLDVDFNTHDVILKTEEHDFDSIEEYDGFDIEYLETFADVIDEDEESSYAWDIDEYIDHCQNDEEWKTYDYQIPEGRILSKHGNTEIRKDQDTKDF